MIIINLKEIITTYIPAANDEPKFFTQFNVTSNDSIPQHFTKEYDIDGSTASLKILSAKFIRTIEGTSIEGQHLTGTKLSIVGMLYINTIMSNEYSTCKNYYIKNKIPFSTFIIVPQEICKKEVINLAYLIEDITVIKLCDKTLFTNVTLLLEYYNNN